MRPYETVYAEHLSVGDRYRSDAHLVTRHEIVTFAQQWDPQLFHTDVAAASQGYFGGLVASGLHSLALIQKLSVEKELSNWAVVAGSALHHAQFLRPLRPGTKVQAEIVITAVDHARPERSRVERRSSLIAVDDDTTLVTVTIENWVRRLYK